MPSCPLRSRCAVASEASLEVLSRRSWVKRFAIGSAVALGLGKWQSTLLADISPTADEANIVTLKLADYPALQADYGSVRFNLFGTAMPDLSGAGMVPNSIVTVTRAPAPGPMADPIYYAMSASCTHQGCIVDPYDNSEGTEAMICYCHGSVYNIQGQVISGQEEGQANLPAYNTSVANGLLKLEIPGLNFKVKTAMIETNGPTTRFKISFEAKNGARYRLYYMPNLQTAPVSIPFAVTATGPITVLTLNQFTTGTRNIWVAYDTSKPSGFYFVELVVETV